MRKFLVVLMALLMTGILVSGAYADDNDYFSLPNDSGTIQFAINEDGEMVYKALNELVVTNDTVTAAETGKHFIIDPTSDVVTMTLPTAAAGLTYEFTSAENIQFYIDPQDTDTIKYAPGGATPLAAGDRLFSPGATGDSVVFTATSTLIWYVSDITTPDTASTFTDGN